MAIVPGPKSHQPLVPPDPTVDLYRGEYFRPADCLGCSILGMYLFGGKFCMWADRSRPCTCAEVVSRHPMCRCDRKHFNDIVWALVTVFQVPLFLPLLALYHNGFFTCLKRHTRIYAQPILRVHGLFSPIPIFSCPRSLSVRIAGSYIYMYIYIYFFVLSKRTPTSDPTVP